MAGAVEVQVAREELFEFRSHEESVGEGACHKTAAAASSPVESIPEARQESATGEDEAPPCLTGPTALPQELGPADDGLCPAITVERHSRLAPYKPGKMTVVLDMDECLLHSKFHGPGAASEAYRQAEERPDSVNEVNSFWVALDDGDTAQVNKRPGLDPFLEALARDYNTIVFTAAMPDYAGPVLDYIDPKGTLFYQRLYRSSCRQVKGAFLKDLSVLAESTDMSRTVLVDNNPLSFICQPTNGVLVASFYDDPSDTALASVMQLIRHLDQAGDVRPILKDMFRLDTLLGEYRNALFDDEDEESLGEESGALEEDEDSLGAGELGDDELLGEAAVDEKSDTDVIQSPQEANGSSVPSSSPETTTAGSSPLVPAANACVFEERRSDCRKNSSQDDDDSESVETEACSEESGESSLGESLATSEEMEMDLGF